MSCPIKPTIFCVSSIRAAFSFAFAFSFHFCPGCPWTTAVFWGGGSRCMWSGEDWSKTLVVMVPFLPQTFCVNHFISSIFWGSLSCFRSLWDLWLLLLKWVLRLHILMQLIIQLWNERYIEEFQKRNCDWNSSEKLTDRVYQSAAVYLHTGEWLFSYSLIPK